ncbi:MAG: hypothetical protein IBX55_15645 [Methyloprofundus sp.]|uniref:hypothetical protein n=1 Tax=Thiomicrospira sp. TaxID=935 RepID=UPI0019F2CD7E|nr:hypothetical protein [Methyloprofundus sp.]
MRYAEDVLAELSGLKRVVFIQDWKNLSETASVKEGAIGYITAESGGIIDVVFREKDKDLVKPNTVGTLMCCGVPVSVISRT